MRLPVACLAALCLALPGHAQVNAPVPAPINVAVPASPPTDEVQMVRDEATVVVTGVQPGPGLWKVSASNGHVLWILGTLSPLPRRISWLPREVEAVLAQSQEVIDPPGFTFSADVGLFRGLLLVPSMLKARRNPDGRTLQETLPAPMYARWQVLKARYIGRDAGVEKWRPIFAGYELYEQALKQAGLVQGGVIGPVLDAAVKKHKIKRTSTVVKLKIEEPKQAIKEFSAASLGDIDCMDRVMDRLETDLATMGSRANAWAVGDIETLRNLRYDDQNRSCIDTILQTGFAQKRGMEDLPARIQAKWMGAATTALASNRVSFATLPVSELLKDDGYLARLRASGYQVEAPAP